MSTSKNSNGSNTTVWLVRFTVNGGPRSCLQFSQDAADNWRRIMDATVTPIDCAAVEELVEAVRNDISARCGGPRSCRHDFCCVCPSDRLNAALAAFRSTP